MLANAQKLDDFPSVDPEDVDQALRAYLITIYADKTKIVVLQEPSIVPFIAEKIGGYDETWLLTQMYMCAEFDFQRSCYNDDLKVDEDSEEFTAWKQLIEEKYGDYYDTVKPFFGIYDQELSKEDLITLIVQIPESNPDALVEKM